MFLVIKKAQTLLTSILNKVSSDSGVKAGFGFGVWGLGFGVWVWVWVWV